MPTLDDLKQQRDGHLEYGRVPLKDRVGLREVYPTTHYFLDPEGRVVGKLRTGEGGDQIGYGNHTDRCVTVQEYDQMQAPV